MGSTQQSRDNLILIEELQKENELQAEVIASYVDKLKEMDRRIKSLETTIN